MKKNTSIIRFSRLMKIINTTKLALRKRIIQVLKYTEDYL